MNLPAAIAATAVLLAAAPIHAGDLRPLLNQPFAAANAEKAGRAKGSAPSQEAVNRLLTDRVLLPTSASRSPWRGLTGEFSGSIGVRYYGRIH